MNGAIYDSTWNVFFKMHFGKLYEGMLATSLGPLDVALGEIPLALLRGGAYGARVPDRHAGRSGSTWRGPRSSRCRPCCSSRSGSRASGMGITSYMKTFQQMDWIHFVLLPMFLFSATFYPITVYPEPIQWVIQALPLWHGVELVRGLTTARSPGDARARALLPRR